MLINLVFFPQTFPSFFLVTCWLCSSSAVVFQSHPGSPAFLWCGAPEASVDVGFWKRKESFFLKDMLCLQKGPLLKDWKTPATASALVRLWKALFIYRWKRTSRAIGWLRVCSFPYSLSWSSVVPKLLMHVLQSGRYDTIYIKISFSCELAAKGKLCIQTPQNASAAASGESPRTSTGCGWGHGWSDGCSFTEQSIKGKKKHWNMKFIILAYYWEYCTYAR